MKKLSLFKKIIIFCVAIFVTLKLFDRAPTLNLQTKICVVTGVSSGIGKQIAVQMLQRGWKVIGVARREQPLKKLQQQLGENFVPYTCDVSKKDQVDKVSAQIKNQYLQPTLFFLNAGTGDMEMDETIDIELHRKIFDTNYFGVLNWVERWLQEVQSYGGGTFVATSSSLVLYPMPNSADYGASKAALNASFQSLRLQHSRGNVGFVVVMPGPVDTHMLKTVKDVPFTQQPQETARYIVDKVFTRHKQIEPSWFHSFWLRLFNYLPDWLVLKIIGR